TKAAATRAAPADPCAILNAEAERILRFQAERAGIALIEATGALICLGDALLRAYERRKRLHGLLDYDDLVLKAVELLRRPGVAAPRGPPDGPGVAMPPDRPAEPPARLARGIAATIARWLATGERLEPRGRALRPGDVMVLVRRRNAFVRELLRALKQQGVPVAGADRLVLAQEMAVQDLMALGRFLLLPEDNLTLATVLKGPLFGLSEDELFLLAHGRGEATLWSRLRRFAPEYPTIAAAAERLRELLARADFVP